MKTRLSLAIASQQVKVESERIHIAQAGHLTRARVWSLHTRFDISVYIQKRLERCLFSLSHLSELYLPFRAY